MKSNDVFKTIVSETTGCSENDAGELLQQMKTNFPNQIDFEKELTDNEAQQLLEELRKGKSGIRDWLIKGDKRTIHS